MVDEASAPSPQANIPISSQVEGWRGKLARMRTGIERAVGAYEAESARDATLTAEVAAAKGRLEIKPDCDLFLENIQQDIHRSVTGAYEDLLSALVRDVLTQDVRIHLRPGVERGLAGLDIEAETNGARVNVFDGCGGSLTNIISFGLRAIATRKSGLRFFLALDEADAWIRPGRAPAFYRVIRDLVARTQGEMQALVVTHHALEVLPANVTVVRLGRSGATGKIRGDVLDGGVWGNDDAPGLRSLRLIDFASIEDVTIPLGPGMTVIAGENNIGKSRFMQALRAVFYGESSDGDIRHGARSASVEIGLEGGKTLFWSRKPSRNPVTQWVLKDRDGAVLTSNGALCDTGGRNVPAWVRTECGIGRLEDMDLQISRQMTPVFLLDQPSSRRAQVLSVGRESARLLSMLELHKQATTADRALVQKGERDIAAARKRIEELRPLAQLAERLGPIEEKLQETMAAAEKARALYVAVRDIEKLRKDLEIARGVQTALKTLPLELQEPSKILPIARTISDLKEASRNLQRARAIQRALEGLPNELSSPAPIAPIMKTIAGLREMQEALVRAQAIQAAIRGMPTEIPSPAPLAPLASMVNALRVASKDLDRARAVQSVLANLPDEPIAPRPVEKLVATIAGIVSTTEVLRKAQIEAQQIEASQLKAHEQLARLIEASGGMCPTCGHDITPEQILTHDLTHGAMRA